jgi:hypothetical protein
MSFYKQSKISMGCSLPKKNSSQLKGVMGSNSPQPFLLNQKQISRHKKEKNIYVFNL